MDAPGDVKARPGVRFLLDGELITARDVPPTLTLLQYLREHLGRTGTKEGCAEGDCGACTVVVGRLREQGGIDYQAVNSCIRFLPTVDGLEVVTVESLRSPVDGAPHPVQRAMVDCHASQCGFCTPGFVMSLFALSLKDDHPSRETVVDALAGNLCRCTGYRPIIEAGCRMHDYPEPEEWSRSYSQCRAHEARLHALQLNDTAEPLPGFHAPRSIEALAALYLANPGYLLLAGGTDIGLWVTKHLRELPPLIYLGEVSEFNSVREVQGRLEIGAAVPLSSAFDNIVARYPMLAELAGRFASPPIRNSGTLCGNIANGSPIGDSMPILIALGATVLLRRGEATRTLALEDLFLAYQKKALQPGEFVQAVHVPLPAAASGTRTRRLVASYKVAKRYDQDISAVCAAFVMEVSKGFITAVRIAYGGMAATPKRALRTEAALMGKPWSEDGIESALSALEQDYQPLSDMRAGSLYRQQVAQNLLKRFYLQHAAADYVGLHDLVIEAGTA